MNTETMNTELLWRRMQKDWQSAQPAVDASALVRQVSRKHRFISVCVAVDIVATFAFTGVFAYSMFTGPGAQTTPLAILLALLWIGLFAHIWIRRDSWRAQGTETRALLQLVERRAIGGIRYAWLQLIAVWVLIPVAILGQWRPWVELTQTLSGWILVPAIAIAGVHIWALRYRRRQLRKLQHTRALLEQLSREDRNP